MSLADANRPWDEFTITANNASVGYNNPLSWYALITYPANQSITISDVTVKTWVNLWVNHSSTNPNYGIVLSWFLGYLTFFTRECSSNGYPASYAPYIVVDYTPPNTAPNPPVITTPNWNIFGTSSPTFTWNFNDPDSGDYQTAYWVDLYGADNATLISSTGWIASGAGYHTITGVGDGNYHFRVYTRDKQGVQSTYSVIGFQVDTAPPTITSVQGTTYQSITPNSTFRVHAYGVSDNIAGVSMVRFPTAGPGYDFQWRDGSHAGGGTWYCDIPISAYNNNEGTYTTHVYTYDAVGNSAMVGQILTYADRTPPTLGNPSPQQYTTGTSATVYVDGVTDSGTGINRVQVYQVRPDGSYYDIGNASAVEGNRYSINVLNINVEGNWQFHFRAYDNAGNAALGGSYVAAYVMRDTTAPVIGNGDGDRYSNQNSGVIRHTITNVADATSGVARVGVFYRKSTDNGATWGVWSTELAAVSSGSNWYYDIPINGDGKYQVDFRAYDRANNVSNNNSPYTMYTTIDSALSSDPNPQVIYGTTSASFTWNAFSDPSPSSGRKTTNFTLGEWNGSAYLGTPLFQSADVGNVLSKTVTGLIPGKRYRYTVSYTDNSNNIGSFTYKEFITKKQIGTSKLKTASGGVINLPIYALSSGVLGSKACRVAVAGGTIGCYELVLPTDPNASAKRIYTSQGTYAIAK
ncbi:hypothetical protein BK127_23025 [Paenibacillus sp. FSL H7-0331]|nr:hypothetical protein BK127_23025 [Paenibacillus sp. FSL H7-0331]